MELIQTVAAADGAGVLGAADELLGAMAAIRRAGRQRGGRPRELAALTSAQLELVRLLRRQPGLCVAEAAQELRLAPNTVSTLVRELVAGNVLERRVDEADRRVARLDLVPEMRRKLERWRDERVLTLAAAIDSCRATTGGRCSAPCRYWTRSPMRSRRRRDRFRESDRGRALAAVDCQGLRHRFGDHVALDGVDLIVAAGEVFGLLGPNGAGKTTTIRIAQHAAAGPGGDGRGARLRRRRERRWRSAGCSATCPQQLSIEAALTGPRERHLVRAPVRRPARRARASGSPTRSRRWGSPTPPTGSPAPTRAAWSGGSSWPRRSSTGPALLVLDEPTVGLDPVARDGVWQRVEELREATGMTVLLTTHYMEEADALCDRVALMHLGHDPGRRARPTSSRRRSGPRRRSRTSSATTPATASTGGRRRREVCVRSARTRRTARRVG